MSINGDEFNEYPSLLPKPAKEGAEEGKAQEAV